MPTRLAYPLLLLFLPVTLFGQETRVPKFDWFRVYDGPANRVDLPELAALDHANHLVIYGRSAQAQLPSPYALLVKFSPAGDTVFAVHPATEDWSDAYSMVITSENDIYITGLTSNNPKTFLQRYDPQGLLKWERIISGEGGFGDSQLLLDSRDNLIVNTAGLTFTKLSGQSTPDTLWTFEFTPRYDGYPEGIFAALDSQDQLFALITESCWLIELYCSSTTLIKLSSDGQLMWAKDFYRHRGIQLLVDHDDHPVFITNSWGTYLQKFSSTSDSLWTVAFESDIETHSLTLDSQNNLILMARNHSSISEPQQLEITKISPDGETLWAKTDTRTSKRGIVIDPQGNLYVSGNRESLTLAKFDPNGGLLWEEPYSSLTGEHIGASWLFSRDYESFFFAGSRYGSNGYDFFAAKLTYVFGVSIEEPTQFLPTAVNISQNTPNPFNPVTTISFTLPASDQVTLHVYDSIGSLVATLANGVMSAGDHQIRFDGSHLSSGMYLYVLSTSNTSLTRKMMLVK